MVPALGALDFLFLKNWVDSQPDKHRQRWPLEEGDRLRRSPASLSWCSVTPLTSKGKEVKTQAGIHERSQGNRPHPRAATGNPAEGQTPQLPRGRPRTHNASSSSCSTPFSDS